MIGGYIKRVYELPDRMAIWVIDTNNDELAVDVVKDASILMLAGDNVWWQDRRLMWTASTGIALEDVQIDRIGYSYRVIELERILCKAGICPDCARNETMHDGDGRLWCADCGESYDLSDYRQPATATP